MNSDSTNPPAGSRTRPSQPLPLGIVTGNRLDILRGLPDASIDMVFAMPPAGFDPESPVFREAARVLKPGHFLVRLTHPETPPVALSRALRCDLHLACAILWPAPDGIALQVYTKGIPENVPPKLPCFWWSTLSLDEPMRLMWTLGEIAAALTNPGEIVLDPFGTSYISAGLDMVDREVIDIRDTSQA